MGILDRAVSQIQKISQQFLERPDFVVVDVETTGLRKTDRILEVSAVIIDSTNFSVKDEFDTLVNPLRDVGPTDIHGITASMVESAPTFEEISATLGNLLNGRVLVAHNLSFDKRFLQQEFDRLAGVFDFGNGLCTLRLSGDKLATACSRRGIQMTQHHRALSDARATAELLKHFSGQIGEGKPIYINSEFVASKPFTLRRDALDSNIQMPAVRGVREIRFPTSNPNFIAYLDVLDTFLDDLVLTADERSQLVDLAEDLGITKEESIRLEEEYFQIMLSAAQRDGRISSFEHESLKAVSDALNLDPNLIPAISESISAPVALDGLRVCFTGEAFVEGKQIKREHLELLASKAGMQPVFDVTKSNCDLLVASDVYTMSGKAKKAIKYKIPIISVTDFLKDRLLANYLKNF